MGKTHLHVVIDKELYMKVKELAARLYEHQKGSLSRAVEEALRLWIRRNAWHEKNICD